MMITVEGSEMFTKHKKILIPDLRRKQNRINLKYINLGTCFLVGVIVSILVISILFAASTPNSNMPAGI